MNLLKLLIKPFNNLEKEPGIQANVKTPEIPEIPEIPEVTEVTKVIEAPREVSETGRGYKIGRVDKYGRDIFTDKYTEAQKLFMVNCIAHCMNPTEMADAFFEEYGIRLNHPSSLVGNYKRSAKWKSMIDKERTIYLADVRAVAGAHKRVRLERADRVYERAIKKGQLNIQLSSIEQQRKEFEKYEEGMMNILRDQYATMSDEEIKERKNQILMKLHETKGETK